MKISSFLLIIFIAIIWLVPMDTITKEEIKIGNEKCECHEGIKKMYSDLFWTRVKCNDGESFLSETNTKNPQQ